MTMQSTDPRDDASHDRLLVARAAGLDGRDRPAVVPHVRRARPQLLLQGECQEENLMLLPYEML